MKKSILLTILLLVNSTYGLIIKNKTGLDLYAWVVMVNPETPNFYKFNVLSDVDKVIPIRYYSKSQPPTDLCDLPPNTNLEVDPNIIAILIARSGGQDIRIVVSQYHSPHHHMHTNETLPIFWEYTLKLGLENRTLICD